MWILLCVTQLFICVGSVVVNVTISKGVLIGDRRDGYDTYFGVPYALVDKKHPFGNNIAVPNFKRPFRANDSLIMCPQIHKKVGGTLDCLILNIYVPHTEAKKLSIMVWFHGNFAHGKAGDFDPEHLVKKHIIVITANFRLGPYGFFCLHESQVAGNQGLRDQIAVLRWVKKEIEAFGGDKHEVTIAGEGYGGGFVDIHLYSEYETLFNKAIIQSGSMFTRGFFMKPNPRAALYLGEYFGQSIGKKTHPRDVLPLLNRKDPIRLLNASKHLNLKFAVCREMSHAFGIHHFVTHDPFHLNNLNKVEGIKILIGYNSMEMLPVYANLTSENYKNLQNVFKMRLQKNFNFNKYHLEKLSNILKRFYLGSKTIGSESLLELANSASDFFLNHAVERSVDMYLNAGATVYKYLFSYTGGSKYKHISGSGAPQEEELNYLFNWKRPVNSSEQNMMRDRMTTFWSNFVQFGHPAPFDKPVLWAPVTRETKSYLDINVNMTMKDSVFHERIEFWNLFWLVNEKFSIIYES